MVCPSEFASPGRDPSGFWSSDDAVRHAGACQGSKSFPDEIKNSAFCFSGQKGGIDVDLARIPGASSEACASFGSICTYKKESIQNLQFRASTSGCFNKETGQSVWAAPLWLSPESWAFPQGTTGEIDLLERCGNPGGSGFAINFGAPASPGQQKGYAIPEDINDMNTYYVVFKSPAFDNNEDYVEMYKCPEHADPMHDGLAHSQECQSIGKYEGYHAWTEKPNNEAAHTFRFVTDIWNIAGANAEGCSATAPYNNKTCKYRVKDISARFRDNTWKQDPKCAAFLASSPSTLVPPPPPPSLTPSTNSPTPLPVLGILGIIILLLVLLL